MEVRPARPEDAGRISEIRVRSWQSAYRGLVPQGYLDGLDPAGWVAGRSEWISGVDWTRGGCFVVSSDDGRLAGFAMLGPSRDDDPAPAGVGEVMAIYLAPDVWGEGLGRELMSVALGHLAACGYDQVTLWVLATNDRARRFYQAAGFSPDGAEKVDSSRGFPLAEVRYRRSLPQRRAAAVTPVSCRR
jgi:GNAT superfamily N-acetyltransferase